jgi:hypothetical protein
VPLPLPLPPPLGKEAPLVVVAGLDTGVALDRHKSLGDIDLLDPAKRTNKTIVSQIQYASLLPVYLCLLPARIANLHLRATSQICKIEHKHNVHHKFPMYEKMYAKQYITNLQNSMTSSTTQCTSQICKTVHHKFTMYEKMYDKHKPL